MKGGEKSKSWLKAVQIVALIIAVAWSTGYWFARGIAHGGGLVHITVNYSE